MIKINYRLNYTYYPQTCDESRLNYFIFAAVFHRILDFKNEAGFLSGLLLFISFVANLVRIQRKREVRGLASFRGLSSFALLDLPAQSVYATQQLHLFWRQVRGNNSGYFRVEEYKKPTFEVLFEPSGEHHLIGNTLVFPVKNRSFAGCAMQHTLISLTVFPEKDTSCKNALFGLTATHEKAIHNESSALGWKELADADVMGAIEGETFALHCC